MERAKIEDWEKRVAVAAEKRLAGAEGAENAFESRKELLAFAEVLDILIQLDTLRGATRASAKG